MTGSVALAHQLRARESMRFGSSAGSSSGSGGGLDGGVASRATYTLGSSRGRVGRRLTDSLDGASLCATRLRTLPSHFQHILLGHTGCVNAVAVSEDAGRWVATGGDDKSVQLWEAYAPLKAVYPLHQSQRVVHEPLAVDDPTAAGASVVRYSSHSYPCAGHIHRGPTAAYRGHRANIFGITFTPDSRRILSCGLDAAILMYDLETSGGGREMRPPMRSFLGHQSSVHRVSLLAGSNDVFLSASNDRTVRLFDVRCETNKAQFVGGFSYSINSVHANPADANTFVTAGESLCLHDVRRMGATKHNADAQRQAAGAGAGASSSSSSSSRSAPSARTRRATRARQLARRALALMGGHAAMPVDEDDDSGDDAGGGGAEEEEEEDEEGEDDFTSLVEFMLSASSHARPMAVLKKYDLTTLTPARARRAPAAAAAAAAPPRRSPRTARGAAAAAASGASGSSRGRGASGSGARGSRASAAAASQVDAAVPSTASRARGRGRGRGGRGGRGGRSSSRGRAASDDDERMQEEEGGQEEEEEEEDESERKDLEAGRAPAPRRSGRLRAGASAAEEARAEQLGIEELSSNDEEEEDEGHYQTPSERRHARLSAATPPREASSCEFSADGQHILACMMKSTPLLFRTDQRRPVVAMQSHGSFSGYSNTSTLKSAVFGGPDERFVIAGSDNFGIYLWDRSMPASDVLASPQSNPDNQATFLNAFKIVRGHRSIPNNQRFHPHLMQIYSCGVEKVVRAFHCTRAALPRNTAARKAVEEEAEARAEGREEEFIPEGDVLTEAEAHRILRAHHLLSSPRASSESASSSASASPSPSSAAARASSGSGGRAKRKLASGSGAVTQLEEKKAKGEGEAFSNDASASADVPMSDTTTNDSSAAASSSAAPSPAAASSSSSAAASSSSSPPARSTRSASTAAAAASSADGSGASASRSRRSTRAAAAAAAAASGTTAAAADRSASPSPEPRRSGADSGTGAGASSSSRPASPELDPLYRMVRTYHRPREPFTRLQCAFLLSGGADAFGEAASLFADADPEEAAELAAGGDDGRDDDSMAEDRACIAQFDWYVSKAAAGEDDDEDEFESSEDEFGYSDEEEEEGEDDDEEEDPDGEGDAASDDSGSDGAGPSFIITTDDLRALAGGGGR